MRRLLTPIRQILFAGLVAAVAIAASERMFWFWASGPEDYPIVVLMYGFALAGVIALIDRYDVRDFWGLSLVAVVVGFIVEGILTPVTYTGGPFVPFFPVWFAAWHGGLAVMLLVLFVRRLLLDDARAKLAVVATGLGAFWGLWSLTLALPENLEDPELIEMEGGPLHLLNDVEFAVYALWVSAAVAAAHYLLGRGGWMTTYRPGRILGTIWLALSAIALAGWTVAIPWAAPMFAVYVGGVIYILRRRQQRSAATGEASLDQGRSILADLAGPVRLVSLLPLAAMPVAAAAMYSLGRLVDPGVLALQILMYGTIVVQTLIAAVVIVKAVVRCWRTPNTPPPVSTEPVSVAGGSTR
jgi:hypothetical protein